MLSLYSKWLHLAKLETFAEDKLKVTLFIVENFMGKGEIVGHKHFSHYSFYKASLSGWLKLHQTDLVNDTEKKKTFQTS